MLEPAFRRTSKPQVSVIVLAYNSAAFILECIDSIRHSRTTLDFEIIILDNASTDSTSSVVANAYQRVADLHAVRVENGLGYAGGNNYAASLASGDVLLFLNDDCVLEPGTLEYLWRELDSNPDVGILQCALTTADGKTWDSLGTSMNIMGFVQIIGSGTERGRTPQATRRVFAAAGAAFAIRRRAFDELGGFDASYMFLFEETDICWRAQLLGYQVQVSTYAIARHRQLARYGVGNNEGAGSALFLFTRNRIRSLLKNLEAKTLAWVLPLHCSLLFAYALLQVCRGRGRNGWDILHAVAWNIKLAGNTLIERRRVQCSRRLSDCSLLRSGRIDRLRGSSIFGVLRRLQRHH